MAGSGLERSCPKAQDPTLSSSKNEILYVTRATLPRGQRGLHSVVTSRLEPRGSAHQGLRPRGSDSPGLHKEKMYFLPLRAEMLFYTQQIRTFV